MQPFQKKHLRDAQCKSLLLWFGYDYNSCKPMKCIINGYQSDISEQYLLDKFGFRRNYTQQLGCDLIKSYRSLSKTYRGKPKPSPLGYQNAENYLTKISGSAHTNSRMTIMKHVEDFSKALSNTSSPDEYQTLAARLMFFVFPTWPIYQYSYEIENKIGGITFTATPNPRPATSSSIEKLLNYYDRLDKIYKTNKIELSKFKLPPNEILDPNDYKVIQNSDWWQRRVLDTALKNL